MVESIGLVSEGGSGQSGRNGQGGLEFETPGLDFGGVWPGVFDAMFGEEFFEEPSFDGKAQQAEVFALRVGSVADGEGAEGVSFGEVENLAAGDAQGGGGFGWGHGRAGVAEERAVEELVGVRFQEGFMIYEL